MRTRTFALSVALEALVLVEWDAKAKGDHRCGGSSETPRAVQERRRWRDTW